MLVRHAARDLSAVPRPVESRRTRVAAAARRCRAAGERGGERFRCIQLIDMSRAALDMARYRVDGDRDARRDHTMCRLQTRTRSRTTTAARDGSLVVLFLGSNIGKFTPAVARELLARIRRTLRPGDALMLGTDLIKPERELLLAYDDPLRVTAAFNRNLLRRNQRRTRWKPRPGRVHATARPGTPSSGVSRCISSA